MMHVTVHKINVQKVSRYNGSKGSTMISLHVGGGVTVDLFMSPDQADILYPALQKVYENAEKTSQG